MNAAMLLLVASSLTPIESAPTAMPRSVFAPSVAVTFASPDASLPAPAAATPAEKTFRVFVGGGAWLRPGQYGLFGGGVTFKPMKSKPELDVQADVYLSWYDNGEDGTSLWSLISFNVLYQLPIKMGDWKMHAGAGVMIDKGSGYADAFFDVKLLFSYLMGSKILRPEVRFGFGTYFVIVALFTLAF